MDFPKDLRYTKDHEWTRQQGGTVTIGVSAFAVEQLGDITLVDLPEVGDEVSTGDSLGVIESVKSVSDFYAPVTGIVSAINEELEDAPELVNASPYGNGWLVKVDSAGEELASLMDSAAYAALVSQQG